MNGVSVPISSVFVVRFMVSWCCCDPMLSLFFFPVIVTVRGEVSVMSISFCHSLEWQDRWVPVFHSTEVLAPLVEFRGSFSPLIPNCSMYSAVLFRYYFGVCFPNNFMRISSS